MPQAVRVAENENVFRRVNERLEELARDGDPVRFVCECSEIGCREPITLSVAEYERVRSAPNRFVLREGHERPDIERVVGSGLGWVVVEKLGAAGEIAEADDPRG
jgi:hypothetical protein